MDGPLEFECLDCGEVTPGWHRVTGKVDVPDIGVGKCEEVNGDSGK